MRASDQITLLELTNPLEVGNGIRSGTFYRVAFPRVGSDLHVARMTLVLLSTLAFVVASPLPENAVVTASISCVAVALGMNHRRLQQGNSLTQVCVKTRPRTHGSLASPRLSLLLSFSLSLSPTHTAGFYLTPD